MTPRDRSALDLARPEQASVPPRRLGLKPLLLAGTAGLGMTGLLVWLLIGASEQAATARDDGKVPASSNPGDLLAGFSGEMPRAQAAMTPAVYRMPERQAPPERPAPPSQPAQAVLAPAQEPAEDEVTREARRQAWTDYYRARQQLEQQRMTGLAAALAAPSAISGTDGAAGGGGPTRAGSAGGGGMAGLGGGIGGMGGGAGGSGAMRPGTMDLGPSHLGNQYLEASVTPPLGQYELKRGDFIACRSLNTVNSEGQGMVKAIVTEHVLDGAGRIMVPAGAEIVGVYDNQTGANQSGLAVGFTDIHFPPVGPEGRRDTLQLGSMPGTDAAGTALWRDQVDRHTGRRLMNAVIRAIAGGGGQALAGMGGMGGTGALASAAGMEVSRTGQGFAASEEGSTIRIRPGYSCGVFLTRSIIFPGEWIEGVGFEAAGQGWAR